MAPTTPATTTDTVRIGWKGAPDTLNPGMAFLTDSYTIFNLVYDTMYELTMENTFELSLATEVTTSADGLIWTYTIRDDARWHDGEPLTANDIAFTYNFYHDHVDFPYLPTYTEHFVSVEAPDTTTVIITLDEAIPNMEAQLVFLYVLPEHIWRQQLNGNDYAEFQNLAMVGSGPFKLTDYAQNEYVHLSANPDYFGQKAKVDELIFQSFANADTLVQALQTGQVDMITEMPNTAVVALRNEADIAVVTGPPLSPSVTDIILNVTEPENCPPDDGICSGNPALLDRNVRLALAHATDKQQIIDVVLLGLGAPGLTLIPDSLAPFYNDAIEDYAFDIDLANQILDDAGYADTDGDGVRETPDGSGTLTFRMNWPSDSINAPRMAELLAANWEQIGVQTEQQALDPDALTSVCCPTFDFDIILWGWGSDPDPNFLLSVMTTDEIPTGNSETGWSNAEYDARFVEQATELDKDKRIELVQEMQAIAHDDIPYIIPYYAQSVQAYRTDRFSGWITDAGKVALEDPSSLLVIEPVQ
ncbi:MAG: ABC transporter substrate-binding protein [Anaerolineales bacterium]|nr:ABC transporter substrate-binding protein [Anaerolineales bacterium]